MLSLNQSGMTGLVVPPLLVSRPTANSARASVTLWSIPCSQHSARTFTAVTGNFPVSIRCKGRLRHAEFGVGHPPATFALAIRSVVSRLAARSHCAGVGSDFDAHATWTRLAAIDATYNPSGQ
jgi:hypothetical protein